VTDLAASLSRETPVTAALEEARAVVANRITPIVADLERALSQRRISYVWQALLAAGTTVTAPVTPGVATYGAGKFVTHSLAYAFDRQRLVSEHPFGFLLEAGRTFRAEAPPWDALPGATITDPKSEMRRLWQASMKQAVRVIGDTTSSAIQEDIDLEGPLAEIKTGLRRIVRERSDELE
jgi:hypothetical protein